MTVKKTYKIKSRSLVTKNYLRPTAANPTLIRKRKKGVALIFIVLSNPLYIYEVGWMGVAKVKFCLWAPVR